MYSNDAVAGQPTQPYDASESAAALAGSLTTVGYALFALNQPGPLSDIQPIDVAMGMFTAGTPAAPAAPAAAAVASLHEVAALDIEEPAPPTAGEAAPVYDLSEQPQPQAAPAEPLGMTATSKDTLALLNEISFLDE